MRSTSTLAATLLGAATLASSASAMPTAHKPTRPAESTVSPSPPRPAMQPAASSDETFSGFDWSSAAIGAAGGVGAFAIAIAGTAGMRRRQPSDPRPIVTH